MESACDVASFPCKYLGLLLSLRRLTKEDLQPILEKIKNALPGWKAAILATSGRLILVRAVLTVIPIYLLIALDAPRCFIKAVDKFRRAFLWRGRRELRCSHCSVNWERVARPLHIGGLGTHNLQLLDWVLRLRWLWLEKTDDTRSWASFDIQVPANAAALFAVAVITTVGYGQATRFWTNRWLHGQTITNLAPELMSFIRKRGWHASLCTRL